VHQASAINGKFSTSSIRVPCITLQRDIHRGYPQIDLEAQLSTVIHR
jgi:hypothetical protein